jgi:CRP/FNR family transcriptional regulator, anaerobic regulatory protein
MAKSERVTRIPPNLSCFTCQSRERSEWCALKNDDLELLNRSKITVNYRPGQNVFVQGNPCNGIYCIEEGTIAIRRVDAQGNSILIRLAHAGQTLGYRDFFGGQGHTGSAEALAPSRVCHVDGHALRDMLGHNPTLGLNFLTHLAEDLDSAEESILQNSALSVRTRLVHLLLTLKDRFAGVTDDGTIELSLPLARQDLAALLGTRPETIARTIHALESDSVATFTGRIVRIPDLDMLLNEIEPYV